ncbi:MAG: peptide-methionine (S)-S-oxide reductase MsrA [Minisyncoccia bacterium]
MLENELVVFGGGCFWCTEAVFKMLRGVYSVEPGYSGGIHPNPTYEQVSSGTTGHVECVKVVFDPKQISYIDLLTVFFGSHDPTTLNRQGADIGEEYRSAIFYTTPEQKNTAEEFIKELNESNEMGKPIVTTVEPFKGFYPAENYHRDYYEKNKNASYCELVINPKLEKVVKKFGDLLNDKGKLINNL